MGNTWIGITVIGMIAGAIFISFLFLPEATFVTFESPSFIQYYGQPTQVWQNNLNVNINPAKIGDYELRMTKTNIAEILETCKPNTCNGELKETDEYGCDIWESINVPIVRDYWIFYGTCSGGDTGWCNDPATTSCDIGSECFAPANMNGWEYQGTKVTGYKTDTCGGANLRTEHGCFYTYDLLKNGNIIEQQLVPKQEHTYIEREDIIISISDAREYQNAQCNWIQNSFKLKIPENAFDFDISSPKTSYIQGEPATIQMKIKNNWVNSVIDVSSTVCQQTFGGQHCEDVDSESVAIAKGEEKIVEFSVPTGFVVEKLFVTPTLKLKLDTSSFQISNLNSNCIRSGQTSPDGSIDAVEDCAFINLGSWTGDTKTVLVNPQPIYVDVGCPQTPCPPDYTCQEDSGLCLRTDIIEKTLSCQQVGCPVVPDKTYQCSSAGICVETIFQYLDCTTEGCPSGTTCEPSSGICIKTEIYDKLIQCSSVSDCMIPCKGVTASCINNKCVYSGECDITIYDCQELGCAEGYVCTTTGVCERTITETQDCTSLGCPTGYTCNSDTGVCLRNEYIETNCIDVGCEDGYICNEERGVCERTKFTEKITVMKDEKQFIEGIDNDLIMYIVGGVIAVLILIIGIVVVKK